MNARERFEMALGAYHDGELGPLRRWWMERRLRRDPEARRELESLAVLAGGVREAEPAVPAAPEIWNEIRRRLPDADAPRAAVGSRLWPTLPWAAAGAALAGAAVVALLLLGGPELNGLGGAPLAGEGAVRWLDSRGQPMMVLQDDREATLIWVRDDDERISGGGGLDGIG